MVVHKPAVLSMTLSVCPEIQIFFAENQTGNIWCSKISYIDLREFQVEKVNNIMQVTMKIMPDYITVCVSFDKLHNI